MGAEASSSWLAMARHIHRESAVRSCGCAYGTASLVCAVLSWKLMAMSAGPAGSGRVDGGHKNGGK
jgi:hypothetical protein